jgi:hypothetical protein
MSQSFTDMDEIVKYIGGFEKRLRFLKEQRNSLVISYLTLRTVVGILGMSLPFVVSLGAQVLFQTGFQSSISAYYHTSMRDTLVGTLWVIGFFLFSYKGYEHADNVAGNLACFFAVGVALFPTSPDGATETGVILIGVVHAIFAVLLFLTLIYFCLFLFTKTDPLLPPTKQKLQRNRVYRACGYTMSVCILLICIYVFLPRDLASLFTAYKPVYWLEALAILAFGISWFTKGEAILKDESWP